MMIRMTFCAMTFCCLLLVGLTESGFAQDADSNEVESGANESGDSESEGEEAFAAGDSADSDQGNDDETTAENQRPATAAPVPVNDKAETKNKTIDGVSALAALVIAAFAVDRFATACMFVLSLIPAFRDSFPSPGDAVSAASESHSEDKQEFGRRINRVAYFSFALLAAVFVVWVGQMGILEVLGFKEAAVGAGSGAAGIAQVGSNHHIFDMALTVLILTAGADRVAGLLQLSGASVGGSAEAKPIEITGTLTIDGKSEELIAKVDGSSGPSDSR